MSDTPSLYQRLGGYDAIEAVATNLLGRLQADPQLGRFWQNRGDDGVAREKQLLIDFLCNITGGPMVYTGRNMTTTHKGMQISESDWTIFMGHAGDTLAHFNVPEQEATEVATFVQSLKEEIVEC